MVIFHNRRGSGRAWICRDCSHIVMCPYCDIALAYHTTPTKRLICHQCNYVSAIPHECPKCSGYGFDSIGIGIQRLETDIKRFFPDITLSRMDSDNKKERKNVFSLIEESHIILSTYSSIGIIQHPDIECVVFALFESDLTIPEYQMEEKLFHVFDYAKKSGKNIIIQTELEKHPLLDICMEGNYKDFLSYMSTERKNFNYPPYTDFVTIRIHDPSKAKVQDIVAKLVNKIEIMKDDSVFLAFDKDIWNKTHDVWSQKIILKGNNIMLLLKELEVEIMRNRSVTLEWN